MTMMMDGLDDSNDFVTCFSDGRLFFSLFREAFSGIDIGHGMDRL